jgi:hypothetical protein
MALAQLNGNVVEHASLLAFYENYFPQIKHIEGKGVTERYITDQDPTKVDSIDIPRLLPMKAHARKIGGASNGGWINTRNANGGYSPEAVFYTVQLNRVFDEDVLLPYTLLTSSKLEFKTSVNKVITDSFAQTINGYTWAGQFKKFFDERAGECVNGLYPTASIRQIMWGLKMKPLPRERWETSFDRRDI